MGGTLKGNRRDPCDDGQILYLDCVAASILAVVLYSSSARGCLWEKLGNGHMDVYILIVFLTTACESTTLPRRLQINTGYLKKIYFLSCTYMFFDIVQQMFGNCEKFDQAN